MSIWRNRGSSGMPDIRQERIAAGTVGGEHLINRTAAGIKIGGIVDDADAAIIHGISTGYGNTTGQFSFYATTPFTFAGTQTIIGGATNPGTAGSSVQYTFKGTSIGVLGAYNSDSGNMRIYIDGVEAKGRVPVTTGVRLGAYSNYTSPVITATDTTIFALAPNASFPTSGYIYIGGEVIAYTSRDSLGFYGLTRGSLGTTAISHTADETIYLWDSSIGLYSTEFANRQVLYYNPLLSPGTHTITVIAETNSTSGHAKIYFDGFITGSIVGAKNVLTQIASVTLSSVATDGNGHADLGGFTSKNNNVAIMAILGYSQTNCESTNTTTMGKLGVKYSADGQVQYYLHNGPTSATINIVITFAYIGDSI